MSRHRSLVATSLYAFAGFNWCLLMSRHRSLVATSAQVFCSLQLVVHDVATSISCRDISLCLCSLHWLFLVSRHHSFSPWLILNCLSCDLCRDLHQISFNFPDVATSSLDCVNTKTATLINQLLSFLPCHLNCTFTPPIVAFSYCFFFFLPHSLLTTNW